MSFTKLYAVFAFLILIPTIVYSQEQVIFLKYECPDLGYSEYLEENIRAETSDNICSDDTQLRYYLTGDESIVKSIELQRIFVGDEIKVKVKINWHPGSTGTVLVDVEFRYKYHDKWGDCDWSNWTYMYTYQIVKESFNPGGTLTGDNIYTTSGDELINLNITYTKDNNYPFELKAMKYYVNNNYQGLLDIRKRRDITLTYKAAEIGHYKFTTELQNECGEWLPGPNKTVSLKPSCFNDDPSAALLKLTDDEITAYDDGLGLTKGGHYTIKSTGITDFSSHYDYQHDGGEDISLSGNTFTINSGLGSYRIEAVPKEGREVCSVVEPMTLFVGGHDITIEQKCLITLPGTLTDFGYDLEPNEPALQHFAATVRSEKGIVIKPGITLSLGAELILDYEEPQPDHTELNAGLNFIQSTSYDEYGRVIGQGRQYFDTQGRPTQSQQKSLSKDVLMGSEVIYDAYGRPAINTLSAPIDSYQENIDECGDQVQTGGGLRFAYKENFVTDATGNPYDHADFDLDGEQNQESSPAPVGHATENTLGWYYSQNNDVEPLTATTSYPYSRTLFHRDGTGMVKGTTIPGDAFRAGSGHVGTMDQKKVAEDDPYLADYLAIREGELGLASPPIFQGNFYKSVTVNAEKMKSVTYLDKAGNAIISLYFGSQSKPITRSYLFYNGRGQLTISLSPNGWQQYHAGANFEKIDKTTYRYDVKGRLVSMTEPDAGTTRYVYRRDGSIRFSQNAEQENDGRYSYTHYDPAGRPVESGEYLPGSNGIAFKSPAMAGILESTSKDGGLPEGSDTKKDRIFSFYDEAGPDIPVNRRQRFVAGNVSFSRNAHATSWYSYDARGRVEWMVQDIKGLGVKTIDYRYGPTGAVQEVAYQKGAPNEDFYHYYQYDADGRLSEVSTATEALEYDKFGELINGQALKRQAKYEYYLHGPLKRVELAGQLQGIDYIYTVAGALKGINHADKALDPGQDGENNSFREDIFGMTLHYYSGDYRNAAGTGDILNGSGVESHYAGNIMAQSWHSPVDGGKRRTYAYSYDDRSQLSGAVWGSHTGAAGNYTFVPDVSKAYQVGIPGYDANGNIRALSRNDNLGFPLADYTYKYTTNKNQLEAVLHNEGDFLQYRYNDIGQMTFQAEGDQSMHVAYNVTGKVAGVYADQAREKPIVKFTYDDRGFRLSKTSFDEEGHETQKTWYVRDASGSLLSTYSQNITKGKPVAQGELPIYGAGKLGMYKPNALLSDYLYEMIDHLGNVRAVIGRGITVEYLATMESERASVEREDTSTGSEGKGFFQNIQSIPTADYINHTPSTVTVDQQTYSIEHPNEVNRINNAMTRKPVGAALMLPVYPGDKIDAEVFVKYADFDEDKTKVLPAIANHIAKSFGLPITGEGATELFDFVPGALTAMALAGQIDEDQPRAFLNYIFFNSNFTEHKFGVVQVTDEARIDGTGKPHERLSFGLPIEEQGYIYIFVSNDDEQSMDVYIDDLKVTHEYGNIVAGSDFYPYGLPMETRHITREEYRYGYQGQFAEKDEEMGWNSFEARMYDSRIGRWISVDPAGQFASPYIGMGNNPVNGIDPDGEWLFGLFGSTSAQRKEIRSLRDLGYDVSGMISGNVKYSWEAPWQDTGSGYSKQNIYNYSIDREGNTSYSGRLEVLSLAAGRADFDALTQLTLGFMGVNAGVAIGTNVLRVGTTPGRALFWSGVRSSAAAEFASSSGLTTLEMTTAGKFLNVAQHAALPIFRNSLWRSVSARFASSASGRVFVLNGSSVRVTSVWLQVERTILMNNYRVTGFHFIGL